MNGRSACLTAARAACPLSTVILKTGDGRSKDWVVGHGGEERRNVRRWRICSLRVRGALSAVVPSCTLLRKDSLSPACATRVFVALSFAASGGQLKETDRRLNGKTGLEKL
jgi:hypothetical protein